MHKQNYRERLLSDIHNKQLPQYLFKYRTIDSTKKLLKNNSLYFATPKDFNDPFDCQIVPNTDNTKEEIISFLNTITKEKMGELIEPFMNEVLKDPDIWMKITKIIFGELINEHGTCCFTEDEKNLLMWSHYTCNHQGTCIKFNLQKDPDFFVWPMPIIYAKNYPDFNPAKNTDRLVQDLMLTKSLDWKYEKEMRIMKHNHIGLLPFKKESLVEIIFGCNADDKEIKKIIDLAEANNFYIKFSKAVKKERQFGLDIVPL